MSYVVLDGPDGCGKSSQALALCQHLRGLGRSVLHVREPGSTPVGEALRQLLLAPTTGELRSVTEALLFAAARAELVATVIAPALARGEVVVGERSFVSTLVYQGLAPLPTAASAGLDLDWLRDLATRVHGACWPDLLLLLDVPAEVARARRTTRVDDRIEARPAAYHDRVRDGFRRAAALEPRARLLDAARPFAEVHREIVTLVTRLGT